MSINPMDKGPHSDGIIERLINFLAFVIDDRGRTIRLLLMIATIAALFTGAWPLLIEGVLTVAK